MLIAYYIRDFYFSAAARLGYIYGRAKGVRLRYHSLSGEDILREGEGEASETGE